MKKEYVTPNVEVTKFLLDDCLAGSPEFIEKETVDFDDLF